jgi:hypothetical protein
MFHNAQDFYVHGLRRYHNGHVFKDGDLEPHEVRPADVTDLQKLEREFENIVTTKYANVVESDHEEKKYDFIKASKWASGNAFMLVDTRNEEWILHGVCKVNDGYTT